MIIPALILAALSYAPDNFLQKKLSDKCHEWNQQSGSQFVNIDIDPKRDSANLVLPPSYETRVEDDFPLVIVLHGLRATGPMQAWYLGLIPELAKEGREALLLIPNGTSPPKQDAEYQVSYKFREKVWQATYWDVKSEGVDDKAYLLSLIEHVTERYRVDTKRIYIFGHSNGGFMAHKLACEESEKFAAMVSFAGSMLTDYECKKPANPVSMLMIHSEDDGLVYFKGGSRSLLGKEFHYKSFEDVKHLWLQHNDCNSTSTREENIQLMKWRYPRFWESLNYSLQDSVYRTWNCNRSHVATMQVRSVAHLWLGFFSSNRLFSHFPVLREEYIRESLDFLFSHSK